LIPDEFRRRSRAKIRREYEEAKGFFFRKGDAWIKRLELNRCGELCGFRFAVSFRASLIWADARSDFR